VAVRQTPCETLCVLNTCAKSCFQKSTQKDEVTQRSECTQEKATDISRRMDRWGGNGSKSRRLWYVRMKDAEKARAEKGIHF